MNHDRGWQMELPEVDEGVVGELRGSCLPPFHTVVSLVMMPKPAGSRCSFYRPASFSDILLSPAFSTTL